MAEIKLELKADVDKVISLVDNEVISIEEGKKLLSQFSKEDLIQTLLSDSYDDFEDNLDDEVSTDIEEVDVLDLEDTKENIEEDDDKPLSGEDDDFEDLLS